MVSRPRTVNLPHGDLVMLVISIRAGPNIDIRGVKFDSHLTFEDHVTGNVSRVSQRIGILRLLLLEETSVLLRCYSVSVLSILGYCSPVWESAAECHLSNVALKLTNLSFSGFFYHSCIVTAIFNRDTVF